MEKIITLTISVSLILFGGYMFLESELSQAATTTATTAVSLTVAGEINLNCSSTASLSPSIAGQTGGTATGTFGCIVTTNNSTGYNMTIQKNQKLQIADAVDQRFDDYTTSTGAADWAWDTVASAAEEFGFQVNSCASTTDIVAAFKDNGSNACGGAGTSITPWHCFAPIPTTPAAAVSVANRTTATPAVGILTIFGLQAQAGTGNNLSSGIYTCTTTVTATTNL